jgi:hypothetical protein
MSKDTESARRFTTAAPEDASGSAAAGPGRPELPKISVMLREYVEAEKIESKTAAARPVLGVILRDIMAERVTRIDAESKIFGNYLLGVPFQRNDGLIDALIDSHRRAVAALTKLRDLL